MSEEQKRELEEQERLEEERKAAAKGENKRERALMDMMGGVLEVKKEDILKQVSAMCKNLSLFYSSENVRLFPACQLFNRLTP